MARVEVSGVRIETSAGEDIVDDVNFRIEAGELLALVGESGSGKSTIGTALLGFSRRGTRIAGGKVLIEGSDVLRMSAEALRASRGSLVSYVPQDPAAALDPAMRISEQFEELLVAHRVGANRAERRSRIQDALRDVNLPSDAAFLARFPHQLSGGQQQRVGIGLAFVCGPKVIVMDEPTTGLDVSTQAGLLRKVRELCESHDTAGLYITHDLAVVAEIAHRVAVLYAGRVVETGSRSDLFDRSSHPYTRGLFAAAPDLDLRRRLEPIPGYAPGPGLRPHGCSFAPRCPDAVAACTEAEPPVVPVAEGHESRCVRAHDVGQRPMAVTAAVPDAGPTTTEKPILTISDLEVAHGSTRIIAGVDLQVHAGECVALVGESGSGKTTLCRAVIGLVAPSAGVIEFDGERLPLRARHRSVEVRRRLQYVFQSPYTSLNPRRTVEATLDQPLRCFTTLDGRGRQAAREQVLERVALSSDVLGRYPTELSGGQRQRVAIARALVTDPDVLVCDEITSALDVSVQASIIELLDTLRAAGTALLFVTHNLALVGAIADRTAVLQGGRLAEIGPTATVLRAPAAEYTRQLLRDTPRLHAAPV
jgi:peptide/nickel transport system ATP-binding protein